MNVRKVRVNGALWVRQSSPNFARLRQSSHEGARMLQVRPGTYLTFGDSQRFWILEIYLFVAGGVWDSDNI